MRHLHTAAAAAPSTVGTAWRRAPAPAPPLPHPTCTTRAPATVEHAAAMSDGQIGPLLPCARKSRALASHAHGGCVRHARARVSRVGHAPQTPPACIRHEGSTGAHLEPTRRARVGVPARSDETKPREARQRSQQIAPLLQREPWRTFPRSPLKVRGASAAARGVGASLRAAYAPSLASRVSIRSDASWCATHRSRTPLTRLVYPTTIDGG